MNEYESRALQLHNTMRANHQAPAISLDRELCSFSQNWANEIARKGQFQHSKCMMTFQGQENTRIGENIFMGVCPGRTIEEFAEDACWGWYKEIEEYNFNKGGFSAKTGHFTQLVWKGSVNLGVGAAMNPRTHECYVVCSYAPAGNISDPGVFDKNVSRGKRKLSIPSAPLPEGMPDIPLDGKKSSTTTTTTTTFDMNSGKVIKETRKTKKDKN